MINYQPVDISTISRDIPQPIFGSSFYLSAGTHSLQDGITPLWTASAHGQKKVVELLLAAGANPNQQRKVISDICTQFQEKRLYIQLATLGATYIPLSQFNEACTHFDKSQLYTSIAKDTWYSLYQLQSSTGYTQSSMKTTLHFGSLVWTPTYVKLA